MSSSELTCFGTDENRATELISQLCNCHRANLDKFN